MTDKLSLNDWMSEVGVDKWFSQLNATPAPLPRNNVKEALRFFSNRMPGLPPEMAFSFLSAMDLSKSVREVTLTSQDDLIAFRSGSESPYKLFYTRGGASMHSSGINPFGRTAVHFKARVPCFALESYTTGAKDVWSMVADYQQLTIAPRGGEGQSGTWGVMAYGGGIQLIIPNSHSCLKVVPA